MEIKVVKEGATDFENVTYLTKDKDSNVLKLKRNHDYYYQVQCQLALTGLEWCDFFSYINDTTFFCERIMFDLIFFQTGKDSGFFFLYLFPVKYTETITITAVHCYVFPCYKVHTILWVHSQ